MYREELKMPTKWSLLFVLPVIVTIVILLAFMSARPVDGATRAILVVVILFEILLSASIIVLFTRLFVSIDDRTLTVGFRAFRERIPLDRIVTCTPTTYRWLDWGGYGIRFNRRGKMYNVPGDGGRAVQITLDNGRSVFFSSTNPDAACAAIHNAQAGRR